MHRCPLYDNVPEIHSLMVKSKSASGKIIPGFLASSPSTKRKRFLLGCRSCNATADEECPIKAKTSIFPVCMMGDAILRPRPKTMLTTPGGKLSWKAFNNGVISNTPCFAGLKMAVLPIMIAGISKQKVSFNG